MNRTFDGLKEGLRRYGSRMNERAMGEYAKCADCDHEKALHAESGHTCYTCGCQHFKDTLMNDAGISEKERDLAIGKPIPSGAGDDAMENAPIKKTAMKEDFKCPKCGDSGRIMVDLERGICVDCAEKLENASKCECGNPINQKSRQPFAEPMCDECIAEEKQHAKGERDYERENAEGYKEIKTAVDCAECGKQTTYISTNPLLDGLYVCAPCFKQAIKGMDNAQGKLIVSGGESKEVAFVECQTCGEGINESRIQEHVKDGHTVEKVMKVLKNDVALGFDYAASTTTDIFDLDNTMCDICRKETGAALEEHLVTRHGMEVDVAGVVARDIEARQL